MLFVLRLSTAIVLFFPLMLVSYVGACFLGGVMSILFSGVPMGDSQDVYKIGTEIASEYIQQNSKGIWFGSIGIAGLTSALLSFRGFFSWCRSEAQQEAMTLSRTRQPTENARIQTLEESVGERPHFIHGPEAWNENPEQDDTFFFTEKSANPKSRIRWLPTAALAILLTASFFYGFIFIGSAVSGATLGAKFESQHQSKLAAQKARAEFRQANGSQVFWCCFGLALILSFYLSHRGWNVLAANNSLIPFEFFFSFVEHTNSQKSPNVNPALQVAPAQLPTANIQPAEKAADLAATKSTSRAFLPDDGIIVADEVKIPPVLTEQILTTNTPTPASTKTLEDPKASNLGVPYDAKLDQLVSGQRLLLQSFSARLLGLVLFFVGYLCVKGTSSNPEFTFASFFLFGVAGLLWGVSSLIAVVQLYRVSEVAFPSFLRIVIAFASLIPVFGLFAVYIVTCVVDHHLKKKGIRIGAFVFKKSQNS